VLPARLCTICMQYSKKPEEGNGSPGTAVIDRYHGKSTHLQSARESLMQSAWAQRCFRLWTVDLHLWNLELCYSALLRKLVQYIYVL
ncbi:hypothetical protein STEG23_030018, partial [Scotinomys teguina]